MYMECYRFMSFYTNLQRDMARDSIIAAHESYVPPRSDAADHGKYSQPNEVKSTHEAVMCVYGVKASKGVSRRPTVHTMKATQKTHCNSKPLVGDHVFKQIKLLAIADTLNPIAKAWVQSAYLDEDSTELFKLMLKLYSINYKVRKGTEGKVRLVVELAIQCAKCEALDRNKPLDVNIARLLGVHHQNYRTGFKPKLDSIRDLLLSIDAEYLDLLCCNLNYQTYSSSIKTKAKYTNVLKFK